MVAPPPVGTVAPIVPTPMLEASPRARSLADQHGILLKDVQPTGPNGRIIERDVQRALADQQTRLTRLAREQAQQEHVSVPAVGSGLGGRVTSADLQITQPIAPKLWLSQSLMSPPRPTESRFRSRGAQDDRRADAPIPAK
ncbi:MAG UNVERIFIED_CONTAM: E3 binding domain-containing protein [Anaerolineae bacterium]